MSDEVKLQAGDGHQFDVYVAEPEGRARGGVVVVQEIFGVNRHIRAVADRFAREGFFAVAPALFDRAEPRVELSDNADDRQKGIALAQKIPVRTTRFSGLRFLGDGHAFRALIANVASEQTFRKP